MDMMALQRALRVADWSAAERIMQTAARRTDAQLSILYNYGKVLFELGRAADAVQCLTRAVNALPSHGNAWFELGRAAIAAQDLRLAQDAFTRALELCPTDRDARRNLGRVALRRGAHALAREVWQGLAGDEEADLALYRCAAELGAPDAAMRRAALLASHPNRAAVIRTLVRVSKGAVPLSL